MSNSDYEEDGYRGRRKGRSLGHSGRNVVSFTSGNSGLAGDAKMDEEIPSIDLTPMYFKGLFVDFCRDYNPIKEIQRKQNHNEAEKKRVRNINKCVDDLKEILDVHLPHPVLRIESKHSS